MIPGCGVFPIQLLLKSRCSNRVFHVARCYCSGYKYSLPRSLLEVPYSFNYYFNSSGILLPWIHEHYLHSSRLEVASVDCDGFLFN